MKKSILILIIAVFSTICAKAQYDAMFTQYMFNEMYINPAYTGSKEAMAVNLTHRQQWVNFPGRPITTSFTLHGPLANDKMGLGISVLNEQIGKLNRNLVYLNYAYRIKTGENGHLSFGIMGGLHNQVNKLSELKATESGDIQVSQNTPSIISPNFGAGIYYYTRKFYAGISVPRMVDDSYMFDQSGGLVKSNKFSANKFHYYLTVGNVFEINDDLKIKPQAMVKMVQNAPLQYDVNVNLLIKNKVWAGVSYRSSADISVLVGLQVTPQFLVNYSYDYALTKIQKYSQGSHEITLGYLFSYKQRKVVTPRYF
ncbi:MAG: type IX secretion system membrane protein PorP/SprF [Bacteroidetes bacterium]|nr:type IX secretion system membrane protein PorP/SprF [Bacteroidota bacterium]